METSKTTSTKNAVNNYSNKAMNDLGLSRKRRIGFEAITCDEAKPNIFVQVQSEKVETMFSKNQNRDIPYLTVVDLETGLEARLWLSGQLRYQFEAVLETVDTLAGLKFEIKYLGKKVIEMEVGGVTSKAAVNQFEIFELN